jgi:hypothetical protein
MRQTSLTVLILSFLLAACSPTTPSTPAVDEAPAQTNVPLRDTAVPAAPTETAVPESKLPAAPFESQPYFNEEAGFALDVPAGWTIQETVVGPRGTQILFVSKPELAEAATMPAGETRLTATIYQWDPKNDLAAYVEHWKTAWESSGFTILGEQQLTLEQGLPAVQFTVRTAETDVVYLVTALKDQYLVLAGEGDLNLVQQIVQRLRPISS